MGLNDGLQDGLQAGLQAMNRRSFLETAGTVTAATFLTSRLGWAASEHTVENIGVQLYTVRDAIAKDFDGSLAKVAAIGYKNVELAGFAFDGGAVTYFGRTPQEMRAALDKHGLVAPSTHVNYTSLAPENFPKVLEASKVLGHKYIVNPWIEEEIRKQPGGWKSVTETFNRVGEASKKAGFQFGYHNHWFEFLPVDGKLPYDILLEGCDPDLVKMELDLCWITAAGADPVKYFEKYPGRFPLVHVKDLKKIPPVSAGGAQNFGDTVDLTEVGSGIIDWKRILSHGEKAGIKLYIVEHDHPKAPFDSIKTSYEYLQKLRF
jgi:sugar phosphate isomerase/epimerase